MSAKIRLVDRIAMTVFVGAVIVMIALGLADVLKVPLRWPLVRFSDRGLSGVVIAVLLIMAVMIPWMVGSPTRFPIPTR